MAGFEYAIVARVVRGEKVRWRVSGKRGPGATGDLLKLLNRLGKKGWEVVSAADLGGDSRADIILKRPLA